MKRNSLKRNFAINVFGALIPLGVSLVTVPIYIRSIGDARYGVLSIVWVLLGYFGFLDLGLSRAAANALARLRNASQPDRARVLITTLTLNMGLGLLGGLCLAISGNYLLQHVLAVPEALKPEIAQAFPWIVGMLPLAMVGGVGIGALESRERFLLANVLQLCGVSVGQILPVILAVTIAPSLAIVIPAAALARTLTVVTILIVVYRSEGPLSLTSFDRHQAKKLLSYGGWISVSGVISPILSSLDQFVIGAVLNVSAVAHYAVPVNLVTRSQIFAGALSRTLFPRMSSVGPSEARALASRSLLVLAYGYVAVVAPAIIVTPLFFKFWIGADFATVAAPAAQILFWGAWINGLAFVPYELLQSQGRPDITGKFHAAEVVPFVAVLWGLTSTFGIIGAALAWSLRCAADAVCLLWIAGTSRQKLPLVMVPPIFLLLVAQITAIYVNTSLWLSLFAAAATAFASLFLGMAFSEDLRGAALSSVARALAFPALSPNDKQRSLK